MSRHTYKIMLSEFHGNRVWGGSPKTTETLASAGRVIIKARKETDCVCGCYWVADEYGNDVTTESVEEVRP